MAELLVVPSQRTVPDTMGGPQPDLVLTAPAVTPTATVAGRYSRVDFPRWLRRYGLALEITLSIAAGLLVLRGPAEHLAAVGLLAVWAISVYHSGRAVTTPLALSFRGTITSTLPALALAGVAVGFVGVSVEDGRLGIAAVLVASAASAAARVARWRLQAPVRVVAVGDRMGVAETAQRLQRSRESRLVGAVIIEADTTAADIDPVLVAVPSGIGLDEAAGIVEGSRADLVIVTPGPGLTGVELKRLHHRLESLPVAVGVLGVLDSVAPHRIRPGWVAGASILDVRTPRPSAWVRSVKSLFDRLLALAALAVAAPVLLVLMSAVRLTSRGPAIFRQVRVGRDGELFTVYKLRTMVVDAETTKHQLPRDLSDSVLFKMRRDPRVTRIGAILRRYSLDELPQLVNVLKGEMSLVGPRPHLPEEIALMDVDTQRRLAVLPGITGLWQVSGRSDLAWEETSRLDTYYADNWSLGGDLKIIAQTIPAVMKARGAY